MGLQQVGQQGDVDLVKPHARDLRAKVRAAAVKTATMLARTPDVGFLVRALFDPFPRVSNTARALMPRDVEERYRSRLVEGVESEQPAYIRRNCLVVLGKGPKFLALPHLIRFAVDDDEKMRSSARALLRDWCNHFNRTYAQPHPDQRAEAIGLLDAHGHALDPKLVRQVRGFLA